jgi:formate hydrogenlyase transcriptional activator
MTRDDNLSLIESIYAAYAQGNVMFILDHVADDVQWINEGPDAIPYAGTFQGPEGVQRFFEASSNTWDDGHITAEDWISHGDKVVAIGRFTATVKSSGKRIDVPVAHIFTIRNRKIVRWIGFSDTAQVALAVEYSDIAGAAPNIQAYEEIAALKARLERENAYLQDEIRREHNFEEIIGNSPELLRLLDRVESAAPTDANVLISGETGSGKELIARAIHGRSARRGRPLVKVNCGAIPPGLVESELFGHVKGAFTSASERRIGRFELADGGTVFLDEVGELPLETQVKLLRVLQEQEFEPVGSNRTIKVNVRIIAATNRDLGKAVQSGQFRSDLYYRLNVIPLHVPALRERRSDIPQMVTFFLEQSSKRIGRTIQAVSQETMRLLVDYSWPGNIRELQNVIERGIVLSKGSVLKLGPDLLPAQSSDETAEHEDTPELDSSTSLEEVEKQHILRVLERTGWLISGPNGAGALLNVHPNTLRSLMKRLGIRRPNHAIS